MRAATKAGFVTGGVVGIAVGAGLLMSPQGRQVRKAIAWGTHQVKHQFHNHIG
ncbi:MAG: YtxH domain-containing protein [Oscillospiraceae bacterium]|jgi:hypothetical protein|nr:YtxH domain-containing protein [Oscillospiraceae bacterium]